MHRFKICGVLAAAGIMMLAAPGSLKADTWRGTAPFCDGKCQGGEETIAVSDYGDGGYCVTGKKVLCRNASQSCKPTHTKATCYGVVMVCENGFQETLNQVWHTCTTYACGACFGAGSQGGTQPLANPLGGPPPVVPRDDSCKQGFVWREAIPNDHVCVPPGTRSQAAEDNARANARKLPRRLAVEPIGGGHPGPDFCKPGFVWREVILSDHVCVTPETRDATARDSAMAGQRIRG